MKGFGKSAVAAATMAAMCLLSGCDNPTAHQSENRAQTGSRATPTGKDDVHHRESSPRDYLASEGVTVTQFDPSQQAALHVTLNVERMVLQDDGYEITRDVAASKVYGMEFRIPTDPKARWGLIDVDQKNSPTAVIFTHRVGPSGTTYSTREYNCNTNMVRYLATGSTISESRASKQDERMSEIVPRSTAYYLGKLACTDLSS